MKRITYIFCIIFFATSLGIHAQTTVDAAAESYRKGEYAKSIELYERIVAQSLSDNRESAEIYYNLGNAYFRNDDIAKAILNYERALLLKPGDSDIRHNLRFARTRIEDRIDTAGNLFFVNLFNTLQNRFTSNTWGAVGIISFLLLLTCIGVFLFTNSVLIKKVVFYTGIVLLCVSLVSNVFAFRQKNRILRRDGGIIMSASASIMTSPDMNSKELFRLHKGTKVKLNRTDGNWYEIEIPNGSVGWTSKDNVEII